MGLKRELNPLLCFEQVNLTFCPLLITVTFANSLDPDHARHFVEPDLDPNFFATLIVFLFFFKKNLKSEEHKKHAKLPSMQRVKCFPML